MGFIENIKECIGIDTTTVNPVYRAVIFGDKAVYLEGVKHIASYTKQEIVLSLKHGSVKIVGEQLYVKKYCEGDIVVCGKILGLTRL